MSNESHGKSYETQNTRTICGQNDGFLNAKAGGTYNYHCAIKVELKSNILE
jgi:hypothetical protein